jgi:hypothetical protein
MRKRNYRSEKTEMVLYPDCWWDGKEQAFARSLPQKDHG